MSAARQLYVRAMAWLFHRVSYREPRELDPEDLGYGFAGTERFFARFPTLSFRGRRVLDYGCGTGTTSIYAALHGATRSLGVDIQDPAPGRATVRDEYPQLADVVELRRIDGPADLGEETFDLVISKNSFEHVADPEGYVASMKRGLAPGGQIVIGFSPLWKAFSGGHLIMTSFPWAHLIFPEEVVLAERRRFIPEEAPRTYAEVRGGLNKMTLGRFEAIMAASGLERTYFVTNSPIDARGRRRRLALRVFELLAKLPPLREYFTFSVHSMWRLPGR